MDAVPEGGFTGTRGMAALGMAALGLEVLPPMPAASIPTANDPGIDLEGPWNTYEVSNVTGGC